MDFNEIMSGVYKALGAALGTIIVTYGTILLNKLKIKLQNITYLNYIRECVKAAEQLYPNLGTKTGEQKYQYVVDQVALKYPKLLENPALKTLIESAVYEICNPDVSMITEDIEELKETITQEVVTKVVNTVDNNKKIKIM